MARTISPSGRVYDRNIPLPLPAERMLTRRLPSIYPDYLDLRKSMGPIHDQGNEGACTGHDGVARAEWIYRRYLNQQPVFSPQYAYVKALIAQGNYPQDEGSDATTVSKVIIANGLCTLDAFPYVSGGIVTPTKEQDINAAQHKLIGAFHGLTDVETLISILADPVPWPVGVGFDVYESFESNETAKTGVMSVPSKDEQLLGGHQTACTCGYDIGITPVLRPKNCPPAIWIQNSWGASWGVGGTFWMPLPVVSAGTTDLKVFHLGPPWKAK